MTDEQLRGDAQDELRWEPRVDDRAIAVSADDGVVKLRGTVGSFRERREATNAVKRVYGTKRVENELEVKLLNDDRRDDADLRGAVLQALVLNAIVPATIDAKVEDGIVTLTGSATHQYQRSEAEYVAGTIDGVLWVDDDVELLAPTPSAGDVKDSIERAIQRDAKLDAQGVSVETANGSVRLTGNVRSWAEHDAAVDAAWSAPGVSKVDDRLYVSY